MVASVRGCASRSTLLAELDKLGATGSSPVPPTQHYAKAPQNRGFSMLSRLTLMRHWQSRNQAVPAHARFRERIARPEESTPYWGLRQRGTAHSTAVLLGNLKLAQDLGPRVPARAALAD